MEREQNSREGRDLGSRFQGWLAEFQRRNREARDEDREDYYYRGMYETLTKATVAMVELGISDENILQKLQTHFDLRRSEASGFIRFAHSQLEPLEPVVSKPAKLLRSDE